MQVVWLRATFFMASSSFPPKSTHTSATCRAGGISEEHRRKCGYICKPEHMRRENMNFKFLPFTPSSRQEWPRWAEMWWGAPRAQSSGEGTVPTTQWATVPPLPRVTSPFLLFLPHLTPAFSHLLPGWTAEGTWWQQQLRLPRERDQEPEKQKKNQKKEKYLQRRRQLITVSHLRCSIWCVLATRWETRVPGMGVVHQKRRRFSLHTKNASLTAQLSNPHQHFLMIILSDCRAKKYLALVIPTH